MMSHVHIKHLILYTNKDIRIQQVFNQINNAARLVLLIVRSN